MKKRDIIEWLRSQKVKRLLELEKSKNDKIKEYYDTIYLDQPLQSLCSELQETFTQMVTLYEEIKTDCSAHDLLEREGYAVFKLLEQYIGRENAFFEHIFHGCHQFSDEVFNSIWKEYWLIYNRCLSNYDILENNIKSRKDAKTALTYLKHIGFDTSALEKTKKPITALAIRIDPVHLFPVESTTV